MRQLEYVRSSTDFIAFLPDGHEHETRTRSSRLSATDIPALVLRTIVTKIAINWSASFVKGSSWSRPQNLVLSQQLQPIRRLLKFLHALSISQLEYPPELCQKFRLLF